VIFATVGSHPTYRFDRFLEALEQLPGEELVVQYGPGVAPPNAQRAVPWMSFPEFLDHLAKADKVVGHAGAGTIVSAARAGHVPVVVPRLRRFGETVDDHQLELARALTARGAVILAEDPAGLAGAVAAAPSRGAATLRTGGDLVAAVRTELLAGSPS
jgi:UDP-N-acetylglucosamine transferase subunit ALG13